MFGAVLDFVWRDSRGVDLRQGVEHPGEALFDREREIQQLGLVEYRRLLEVAVGAPQPDTPHLFFLEFPIACLHQR